ncbi:hypothetical protein OfM1_05920 [Lactovum odontotermitis]
MKTSKEKKTSSKKSVSRKRFSPLLIIAIFFIAGGVAALIYPIVGNYLANQQRSQATSHYNQALSKLSRGELEAQIKEAEKYNANVLAAQQGSQPPFPAAVYDKIANQGGIMGTLDIPAISIKEMPFYHGTNELTLNHGLGHFKPSSIPIGEKNTHAAIAGHSGLDNQVLFTNARSLQISDVFFVNILGKRLAYKIVSMDEVLPSDVSEVKVVPGKDMVTLVTCTPPGINTYRLLITGLRTPLEKAEKLKVISRDTFSYTHIVTGSLIASAALFLALFLIYRLLLRSYRRAEGSTAKARAKKRLNRLFIAVKALFILLIVMTAAVLSFAIYGYTQIQSQQSMRDINIGNTTGKQQLADYNLDKIDRANYTEQDIASVNTGSYANAKINFSQSVNDWGIGKLVIPSQKISLPILAGLDNKNLMNGASTYSAREQLGKGNYVLLAHNVIGPKEALDVLLWRIKNLKTDDLIYASDFKNVYSYRVTSNEVVPDTKVSVLMQPEDRDAAAILTLIRCEGGIGTSWRRAVQAEIVKVSPVSHSNVRQLGFIQSKGKSGRVDGNIYHQASYPWYARWAMKLVSQILLDPVQTVIPIVLLLVIPILFLNLI